MSTVQIKAKSLTVMATGGRREVGMSPVRPSRLASGCFEFGAHTPSAPAPLLPVGSTDYSGSTRWWCMGGMRIYGECARSNRKIDCSYEVSA